MTVKVVILDNLGKCVFTAVRDLKSQAKVELGWKGKNLKGRTCGLGTYALFVETNDKVANTLTRDKARKIALINK
jgi:flagellar hook assembly protein FlgD